MKCAPEQKDLPIFVLAKKKSTGTARLMAVIHISSPEQFYEVIQQGPVVIDFFATWCGPCKMIAPLFEQLAAENRAIKFVKVDVDAFEDICGQFSIRSMPTFIARKNGTEVQRFSGANADKLRALVNSLN